MTIVPAEPFLFLTFEAYDDLVVKCEMLPSLDLHSPVAFLCGEVVGQQEKISAALIRVDEQISQEVLENGVILEQWWG